MKKTRNKPTSYSEAQLKAAVASSTSFSELQKKLGLRGNNHQSLKRQIQKHEIDASHLRLGRGVHGFYLEDILIENSSFTKTGHLKNKLYNAGIKERKCECCGITEWCGKPISFHLHHKNGKYRDNRLPNLEILCPNCHTQTENFGVFNAGNGRPRK